MSIPEAAFAACFSLVETNMKKMYKEAECGWSASDKRVEMREPPTRYLIASAESAPDTVAGFVSYQIDWEQDMAVAYCYELQLDKSAQRLGLGRWLMSILEHMGRRADVEKTMLTVFTANKAALQFYTSIGYEEDETSPQPVKLRSGKERRADYMILSKRLR
ncbi:acyl-CoA N-acyltransferase [Saitoella complicata NRRL Y-17804]|nr:acyl-CoA N-acyltransferase [Saitoella complicata NRRL Y-17804]ODQ51155.1 acyl-CoA N-acyltransferase [Saitoella complicata NRRL Y-17804]